MKKTIMLLSVMVLALMLFATIEANAQCQDPYCFSVPEGCIITIVPGTAGEFPIVLTSEVSPGQPYDLYSQTCQSAGIGFPCFVYPYKFLQTCSYSHIDFALPVSCDTPITSVAGEPSGSFNLPAAGDTSTGWYSGDESTRVFYWPLQLGSGEKNFWMVTNKSSAGKRPIFLKAGKNYRYGTIWGPDCYTTLPARTVQTKIETDFGTITCGYSSDQATFVCTDPNGNAVTPIPVKGNMTCEITDPNSGAYYEIHLDYMSDMSEMVGTGSPCNYYNRIINGQAVVIGIGTDCIRCGPGGACPSGKTCIGGYCR